MISLNLRLRLLFLASEALHLFEIPLISVINHLRDNLDQLWCRILIPFIDLLLLHP